MPQRRILVTSALPYANGHIHIGHLVEYIQTDIWVRFQKLRGHRCVFVCADDTHGTAIMIRARQEGRSEEEVIAEMGAAHQRDFAGFGIEFDNYGSTNSDSNRELCHQIWAKLRERGMIVEKSAERLFDPEVGTFLADRFVKGTCPKCGAEDQHGDGCEKCLAQYSPIELVNPKSTLSAGKPEVRSSTQLYVQIEGLHAFLEEWTQNSGALQLETANFLKQNFLSDELRDWDVSRPARYFGFEIPDSPGNFWYVWFDAPIGYMASTRDWCERNGEDFASWWGGGEEGLGLRVEGLESAGKKEEGLESSSLTLNPQPSTLNPSPEIHHFIGKDITYFHTLFWPAILHATGYRLPAKVHIHGFLTVDGKKMSKRDGTFVSAATYLKHLDPNYLRYYYASKQGPRLDDLDLNLKDFQTKVDSDLVGKVVNIASRCAKLIEGQSLSDSYPDDGGLFAQGAAASEAIATLFEECDYNAAMREIMLLADRANQHIDQQQPWVIRKDLTQGDRLRDVCTVGLNLFRQIMVYLTPVLPGISQQTGDLLNAPITHWDNALTPLTGQQVRPYQHLMKRVDLKKVNAMIEESKPAESLQPTAVSGQPTGPAAAAAPPVDATSAPPLGPPPSSLAPFPDSDAPLLAEPLVTEHCTIEDLAKIDLRVARVIEAKHVAGADKLLQLTLSLGGGVTRNVFAGIKKAYKPEDLVGQMVICCANLKPRQMKFGLSEGMVIAVGPGGSDVFLLRPDAGGQPGMRAH